MQAVRGLVDDLFGVVGQGLRIMLAHLPVLIVIYLLGATGRNGILWLSVWLSRDHATWAWLLMPLAPMSTLTAFILMLRAVAPSLRSASFGTASATEGQTRRARVAGQLTLLASTLIPFLTVYAAQGYLKEDRDVFLNRAAYDDIFGSADAFYGKDFNTDERLFIAQGWGLAAIVVVAFMLRYLLSRFDLPAKNAGLGGFAAYVEVLWVLVLATQFTKYQDQAWQWILDRRFVHWVTETWASFIDILGIIGVPIQAAVSQIGTFIDNSDDILLIPLAWLTVGAVALGGTFTPPEREPKQRPWAERMPAKVRDLGAEISSNVAGRFRGLTDGFRLLALGGLLPMLMFCLAFVLSRESGDLVAEVWRLLVGPQSRNTGLAFAGWRDVLASCVATVVLVGLLAAAIDRIMGRISEPQPRFAAADAGISK